MNVDQGILPGPYQYKLEVSSDAKNFKTVLDKTQSHRDRNVEFDELEPTRCRYIRLTITGKPDELPVGILDFTVFGRTGKNC